MLYERALLGSFAIAREVGEVLFVRAGDVSAESACLDSVAMRF